MPEIKKRERKTPRFFKVAIAFKVANLDAMEVKPEGKLVISKFNSTPTRTIPFHSYDEAMRLIQQVLEDNKITFVQKKVIETKISADSINESLKSGEDGIH